MPSVPVRTKLADDYLAGIGAVCFQWARQERALQNITYGLLKIGPKHGRVAVRSPRATDQLAMIQQLIGLEQLKVSTIDLSALSKSLGELERMRDLAAHGIWLEGPNGEVLLQDLSGSWRPNPKEPKVARRIQPEGVIVGPKDLLELAEMIEMTIGATKQLAEELSRQRGSSLEKSQQQYPQVDPPGESSLGKT